MIMVMNPAASAKKQMPASRRDARVAEAVRVIG